MRQTDFMAIVFGIFITPLTVYVSLKLGYDGMTLTKGWQTVAILTTIINFIAMRTIGILSSFFLTTLVSKALPSKLRDDDSVIELISIFFLFAASIVFTLLIMLVFRKALT